MNIKRNYSAYPLKKKKVIWFSYDNYSYSDSWLTLLKCFLLNNKKRWVSLHNKSVAQITWKACCGVWNKLQVAELLSCKPCEVGVNRTSWSWGNILLLLGYHRMRIDAVPAGCTRGQNVFVSQQIHWDRDLIQQSCISSDEHWSVHPISSYSEVFYA